MIDFLVNALIAGVAIAVISGPLGAIMVFRRMAYFGDTLAHSGLLGVTIALSFNLNIFFGVVLVSLLLGFGLVYIQNKVLVSVDTILGILSHTSLAVGLIAVSFMQDSNFNILSILYGDILTITKKDLAWVVTSVLLVSTALYYFWDQLLLSTIHPELAKVEGVNTNKIFLIYVFLLACIVSIAIKILGVLLITSLLIIPTAIARVYVNAVLRLIVLASVSSSLSVVFGLTASYHFDIPAGPSIVVCLAVLFFFSVLSRSIFKMFSSYN